MSNMKQNGSGINCGILGYIWGENLEAAQVKRRPAHEPGQMWCDSHRAPIQRGEGGTWQADKVHLIFFLVQEKLSE